MLGPSTLIALPVLFSTAVLAAPAPLTKRWTYEQYFDLQGHRGGRGETNENTLPSFAHGLIDGVTSLEMDCGLTRDGHVIVWHDENLVPSKCRDTAPAFEGDEQWPYVGQYIANLTLAQIKTLDCGSLRQNDFPLQEVYPGTKLSTLQEMFDFVSCATDEPVLFNIESKVDPVYPNRTRSPEDFVDAMGAIFEKGGPELVDRITHQSFDWRAVVYSKQKYPTLRTSALCDDTTLYKPLSASEAGNLSIHSNEPSPWLAGVDIDSFPGETIGERVARAAASINADILSPVATSYASNVSDPALPGWIPFTNASMVDTAHELGLAVKPWTPDTKNLLSYLMDLGVDGIITDFPSEFRRHLERENYPLAPKADYGRVMGCLAKLNQVTDKRLDGNGFVTQ